MNGRRRRTDRRVDWDGPRPLNAGVERVLRHLKAPSSNVVRTVFDDWEAMVGELIASHSRPVKIVDGTLIIEVDDPAWASELAWLSADLIERIGSRTRQGSKPSEINDISIKLAR